MLHQRRRRLQAVVDVIGVWETEAREASPGITTAPTAATATTTDTLPAAERVRRSRAEASVRALVDPNSLNSAQSRAEGIAESGESTGAMVVGGRKQEDEPIVALMREWWPKLISAAAEAREWVFLCRYVLEPWRSACVRVTCACTSSLRRRIIARAYAHARISVIIVVFFLAVMLRACVALLAGIFEL